MTLSRILATSLIALALPVFASDTRERATTALPTVRLSGVVRDSTGAPVAGAYVRSGSYISSRVNGTKTDGKYSLTIPAGRSTLVTVEDFAFESVTVTMTPNGDASVDFTLSESRPAVTVHLTNGETHILDLGTSRFAYYEVFQNYARFNNANVCLTDGSSRAPHKSEFAKISGPFTLVNYSPCCTRGPVVMATAEMKTGEKMQVYFNESCFDTDLLFIGRERSTGAFGYYSFLDIAEIDFQ